MATDFVLPESTPAPVYDDPLTDLLQETVVGITGLDGKLVRPRWQPEPGNWPDFSTDWCAIGVTGLEDSFDVVEKQEDEARLSVEYDEELSVLASFYGPHGAAQAGRFRAGISLSQNRRALGAAGVKLRSVGRMRNVPALMKERWVPRIDLPLVLRRRVRFVYLSGSLQSVSFSLDNEFYTTPIIVSPPTP